MTAATRSPATRSEAASRQRAVPQPDLGHDRHQDRVGHAHQADKSHQEQKPPDGCGATGVAEAFDEARQFGRKYGALPQLARATSMSAGFRLSVFDFEGAESSQLEAREIARNAGWHAPVISAGVMIANMSW